MVYIQWNPSIMDTIGTSKCVLLIEVSFVEGSFNIIIFIEMLVSRARLYLGKWSAWSPQGTIVFINCGTCPNDLYREVVLIEVVVLREVVVSL